nr:tyrosine-protein phosphatase Lar isoform X2 [Ciona intestinalis]XP_018669994.1 tyrosine-protein phosphatase Lar isoform X2 [Ciona intestinalis]|eukprot:XP_018669993.1 tyrosine-protein phosphatase Lar isoform X2 [Ciona intestinalis]
MPNINDIYFSCSWTENSSVGKNYTSLISSVTGSGNCESTVTCLLSGSNERICSTSFYANSSKMSCPFLMDRLISSKDGSLRLTIEEESDSCTTVSKPFDPCNNIVLGPPTLNVTDNNNIISVSVGEPECLASFVSWADIKYTTKYTLFDGTTTTPSQVKTSTSFTLESADSRMYTFIAYAEIAESQQPGIPATTDHLTKPHQSTDNNFVDFSCSDNTGIVTAKWQKTGIIDLFKVAVFEEKTLSVQAYHLVNNVQNENIFSQDLTLSMNLSYTVSLIASNQAGESNATELMFTKELCDQKNKVPQRCTRVSGGQSWMLLSWQPPAAPHSYEAFQICYAQNSYESVKVCYTANTQQGRSNFMYNVTELQLCTLYEVDIASVYGEITVGKCAVTAYTMETAPISAPNFEINSISSNEIKIEIFPLTSDLSCGDITSYNVTYNSKSALTLVDPSGVATLSNLNPYTEYNIKVAAVNNAGTGPFNQTITKLTEQAAPSNPPTLYLVSTNGDESLIQWLPPNIINGQIYCYIIMLGGAISINASDIGCNIENKDTLSTKGDQTNITLNLESGTILEITACTGNGTLCSDWSAPIQIPIPDTLTVVIIASVTSVVGIVLILGIIYICFARVLKTKITKPVIHKEVLNSFSETPVSSKCATVHKPYGGEKETQYEGIYSVYELRKPGLENKELPKVIQEIDKAISTSEIFEEIAENLKTINQAKDENNGSISSLRKEEFSFSKGENDPYIRLPDAYIHYPEHDLHSDGGSYPSCQSFVSTDV